MTQDDLSFLPLRVIRVGVGGKRSFDPMDKRRLIEAHARRPHALRLPGSRPSSLRRRAQGHEETRTQVGVSEEDRLNRVTAHSADAKISPQCNTGPDQNSYGCTEKKDDRAATQQGDG
jgi:hypothetical protein